MGPQPLVAASTWVHGSDRQADVDAAIPQDLVLLDHLVDEAILPTLVQQDGNLDPLERLPQSHRSPHRVVGVRRREPLPVRHRAAGQHRVLGTDER